MKWMWQQKNWPDFVFNDSKIMAFEREYAYNAGMISMLWESLDIKASEGIKIDLLSNEAFRTSEIEWELLNIGTKYPY
ncbi:hypothetical protein FACS189472_02500 [Alphaproteobacteria bacterium]|nr:hypothetical protein FACS189472_02500 [Alphaproteobacteria bacterium]